MVVRLFLRLSVLIFIGLVFQILNASGEEYKCREPIRKTNNICTISNYTSNDFNDFTLDTNYNSNFTNHLVFINSNFEQLTSKLFEYFVNLISLDVSHNHIKIITETAFHSASKLEKLILSNNKLEELYNNEFYSATNLICIDLSHNEINKIIGQPFKGLNKILIIDLSNNQIKTLPDNLFQTLRSVNEVNFNDNQIRNSSEIKFNNNGTIHLNNNRLESLNINNNLGSILYADNNDLRSDDVTAGNTENLIKLSLRNNSLTSINFIKNMSYLSYLDLSHNPLHYDKVSDSEIFNDLTNLQTLKLQSINSNNFDFTMLNKLPDSLQILDVSSNELTSIDLNSFSTTNLTHLNIKDNHLGGQTFEEFDYLFPYMHHIDISENDWSCSALKEVLTRLKQLNIGIIIDKRVRDQRNIRGIRCFENPSQPTRTTQTPKRVNNENCVNQSLELTTHVQKLKLDIYDHIKNAIQNISIPPANDCSTTNYLRINIVQLILLIVFGILLMLTCIYIIRLIKEQNVRYTTDQTDKVHYRPKQQNEDDTTQMISIRDST